jgi:hypothetical protein
MTPITARPLTSPTLHCVPARNGQGIRSPRSLQPTNATPIENDCADPKSGPPAVSPHVPDDSKSFWALASTIDVRGTEVSSASFRFTPIRYLAPRIFLHEFYPVLDQVTGSATGPMSTALRVHSMSSIGTWS